MVFHSYKLTHFGKDSTGAYLTTGINLTEVINMSLSFGLGERADSFTVSLEAIGNFDFDNIKIDDRFKIYLVINTTETLLMDGLVQDKKIDLTTDNNMITINGMNRLEKLFNAQVSTTGESVKKTATYWITNIIDQVNEFNLLGGTNREILYTNSGLNPSIAQTKSDGSAFETISFVKEFDKAFKLIDELSQEENTGDGTYIYYMDENNYFHWKPKPEDNSGDLNYGTELITSNTTKAMYEIVNYIILNCGKNCFGNSILQFDYDVESINKYGWKTKLISLEDISNVVKTRENNLMTDKNVVQEGSDFPSDYPYTTSWGEETTNDSNYNSKFVDYILELGAVEIKRILNKSAGASYKSVINTPISTSYNLGDNYNLLIPKVSWASGYELRIITMDWKFNKDGWDLNMKLEEDSEFARET